LIPCTRSEASETVWAPVVFASTGGALYGNEARLPGSLEATVFRIVQEALNNARRHGQPTAVEVIAKFQPDSLEVLVRDNGIGMDVAAAQGSIDTTKHFGLISMRERTELEKGHFRISSTPGKGTEVAVSFPLSD